MANKPHLPSKSRPLPWPAIVQALSVRYKCATRFGDFTRHIEACRERPPDKWGYKLFSQSGEDGYIAALVDRIGLGPRKFVEFGFAPVKNNLLGFAMYHRSAGLFMDCSKEHCRAASRIYHHLGRGDLQTHRAWIDKDNIDGLLVDHVGSGEIDILSIDVDGNDYWLWQNIVSVRPRIVVAEYNAGFGPHRAVTVEYDPNFDRTKKLSPSSPHYDVAPNIYYGASLAALAQLGESKGYALICCEAMGVNAFFVCKDLLCGDLTAHSPRDVFLPHRRSLNRGVTQAMQEEALYSQPLVEI